MDDLSLLSCLAHLDYAGRVGLPNLKSLEIVHSIPGNGSRLEASGFNNIEERQEMFKHFHFQPYCDDKGVDFEFQLVKE